MAEAKPRVSSVVAKPATVEACRRDYAAAQAARNASSNRDDADIRRR